MKPARKRELVLELRTKYGVSERHGCRLMAISRLSYLYKSVKADQVILRKRIREISDVRVRYGYRRIHTLLRREGWSVNHKRVFRLYRADGLSLRNKRPRRHVSAAPRRARTPITVFGK